MFASLLIAATLQTGLSEFRSLEARFPFPGTTVVRLEDSQGSAKWMLPDSGFTFSFMRTAKPEGDELGFQYSEGGRIGFSVEAPPEGFDTANLDPIKADGVLGIDNMEGLAWFLDYRNQKVRVRFARHTPEESVLAMALRQSGRRSEPALSLPLVRDDRGMFRVAATLGDGSSQSWVLDTGSTRAFPNCDHLANAIALASEPKETYAEFNGVSIGGAFNVRFRSFSRRHEACP